MKCFDTPCEGTLPYPDMRAGDLAVQFDGDLVLYRPNEPFVDGETGAPLNIEGDVYLLGAPFAVTWTDDLHRVTPGRITIPARFITDLTSVPPVFRGFVSRAGPWLEAAILHDYLYVAWQDDPDRGHREADRRFADEMMLAAMKAADVGRLRRMMIFAAVRLFGAPVFHRHVPNRFANCLDPTLRALSAAAQPPSPS